MMNKIKFHLDEHIDHAVARALRSRGVNVTTSTEIGLISVTDQEQLNYATLEMRVLVTQDEDFLALHAAGIEHAGICYCHQQKHSIGDLMRLLLLVHDCLAPEEMLNHVEYL